MGRTLDHSMESADALRPFINNLDLLEVSPEVSVLIAEDVVILANEIIRMRAFIRKLTEFVDDWR